MKKRSVLLTIDDPEVAHLLIDMTDEHDIVMDTASVPVPPDDQLTRALRLLAENAEVVGTDMFNSGNREQAQDGGELVDAAMLVRAALGLDEENHNE